MAGVGWHLRNHQWWPVGQANRPLAWCPIVSRCALYGWPWAVGAGTATMRAMTGPGLPQQAPWLLGRDRECAAIDALLADGRAGAAGPSSCGVKGGLASRPCWITQNGLR